MPINSLQQIAETVTRASCSFKEVEVKDDKVKIAGRFNRKDTDHGAVIRAVVNVATRDSINSDTVLAFANKIKEATHRGNMFAWDFSEAAQELYKKEQAVKADLDLFKTEAPLDATPSISPGTRYGTF